MIKYTFTLFCLLCSVLCFSQEDTSCVERRPLPEAGIKATIKGYNFANELDVKRTRLKTNFSLLLSDRSFEVIGFQFSYYPEEGDVYTSTVCGEDLFVARHLIFNFLRPGGFFEFTNITVEKGGLRYHVPNFMVFPID